jgi:hypothetical protein
MKWLVLLLLLVPTALAANASLVTQDGTPVFELRYDRSGSVYNASFPATFGADAYIDQSPTNPDVVLELCHPDLQVDDHIDLRYVSEDEELSWSLLNFKPRVSGVTAVGSEYCSTIDVDLSSINSLYPGHPTPFILRSNGTDLIAISDYDPLETILNGSFQIGIEVRGPPKQYFITIDTVFDEMSMPITRNQKQMITSIVAANGSVIERSIMDLNDFILFDGSFQGGERIYVNGILSLEVKVYEPCEPLNESGYYILNNSKNNHNETCVVVENASNIVLNFVGEQIDGDNLSDGSRAEGQCPVDVRNSRGITFENLKTSQYRYGLCVTNSSVAIFGDSASFHDTGILIRNDSYVLIAEAQIISNDANDINASGNSLVKLYVTNFSTSVLNASFVDSIVRPVHDPPPPPDIEDIKDIGQWVEFIRNGPSAWAQIGFRYDEPLPNDAVIDNVSIFRYNGTYVGPSNQTGNGSGNQSGNVSIPSSWIDGEWEMLFTLVAPQLSIVFGPNLSDYSVFAPYAFESTFAQPEPEPEPDPDPEAGSSGGSGGTPSAPVEIPEVDVFPEIVELELELPENITVRQGEIGSVLFNLTNIGGTNALNISIETQVPREWEAEIYRLLQLPPGERVSDSYLLSPDIRAQPREYFIPVDVFVDSADGTSRNRVLRDVLRVIVLPRGDLYRLRVIEYPPVIRMNPNSRQDVSFLVENIGDNPLDDIRIRFDPTPCLTDISGTGSLGIAERAPLTYTFRSAGPEVCEYLLKFEDGEGRLVGFVPVTFLIQTRPLFDRPLSLSILIIILTAWTMLTAWVIRRRRY